MRIEIDLDKNEHAIVARRAAAAAKDITHYLRELVKQQIAAEPRAMPPSDVMLPRDRWKAKFDAVLASMPAQEGVGRVDCSRDTIYGDRGR